MGQTNNRKIQPVDIASALRDAKEFINRARRALGHSDKAGATEHVQRALGIIRRAALSNRYEITPDNERGEWLIRSEANPAGEYVSTAGMVNFLRVEATRRDVKTITIELGG